MNEERIITLLTDFSTKDSYVGQMKGVILSINPCVKIIDITHEIEPQDIREAAFVLKEYYQYFPYGTIHVAIVDPEVGGKRRPLVCEHNGHIFIGPDNGIFTLVLDDKAEIYHIENRAFMLPRISNTFHGRDVFSPVAAHLSKGIPIASLGEKIEKFTILENCFPLIYTDIIYGEIVRFDRFGNAITNIDEKTLDGFIKDRGFKVSVGKKEFKNIKKTYFEGEFSCLIGSSGYLEFAYYKGSIKDKLGIWKGDEVIIKIL
ncbi:MAG TPA: SAM-dependent chlorinase/fluorinase [Syntrophorhabdaceae bacterium]|nr:SAM-dependent chlorinase/fluorinase [Syntrophorhabdaceae bacterium]HPU28755.1 SAM-dependent chlorinase/fluorinase [Syntrophorhabdaceae bacterium]